MLQEVCKKCHSMFPPAWSCWVRRFTAHTLDTPSSGVNPHCSLQRFICHPPDSADCQGVLGVHLQVTGKDVLQDSYLVGTFPAAHTKRGHSQIVLHRVRGRRRTDTQLAAHTHQHFVCSLQIQLCFLPVTQIPQLHIAVASVVGTTVCGLSAQSCRILVQP